LAGAASGVFLSLGVSGVADCPQADRASTSNPESNVAGKRLLVLINPETSSLFGRQQKNATCLGSVHVRRYQKLTSLRWHYPDQVMGQYYKEYTLSRPIPAPRSVLQLLSLLPSYTQMERLSIKNTIQ